MVTVNEIWGHMSTEELLGHIYETVQTASLCLHTMAARGDDTGALETSLRTLHEGALDAFLWGDGGAMRALHRELGSLTRELLEAAHGRKTVATIV